MSKLAKFLIADLQEDWTKPSIKFFRSSGAYGYIIWLTIINNYYEKRMITVEIIVLELERYASRRTILDFIQKGVEAKFLCRKESDKDKRKTFIEPSKITIQEYNEWSREFIKNII
ncbi:hypothetical protein OAC07_00500 [Candidatus Pelagibacter sp.]|nr:hypothetical protein [Candidatus Pelagibacter sp.]